MPKKWENNWEKIEVRDIEDLRNKKLEELNKKDLRNKKLLTLGNLAIITQSLNASIRDSNWEIKKNGTENKNGLIHFSAGIETLAPYLKYEKWNEDTIEKRASFLYNEAVNVWEFE